MAKKKNDKKKKNNGGAGGGKNDGGLMVDPARIRFQHSRIRPFFSGCGRSVTDTLDSIRNGDMSPSDLPPIQVLVGPASDDEGGGVWYFSLNNRRLWVLKRCREEGLLENNQIYVRVRQPKSEAELSRYTVENCALEAKIMPDKASASSKTSTDQVVEEDLSKLKISKNTTVDDNSQNTNTFVDKVKLTTKDDTAKEQPASSSSEEDSSDEDEPRGGSNRFASLF